jgi:hypothetical protein
MSQEGIFRVEGLRPIVRGDSAVTVRSEPHPPPFPSNLHDPAFSAGISTSCGACTRVVFYPLPFTDGDRFPLGAGIVTSPATVFLPLKCSICFQDSYCAEDIIVRRGTQMYSLQTTGGQNQNQTGVDIGTVVYVAFSTPAHIEIAPPRRRAHRFCR